MVSSLLRKLPRDRRLRLVALAGILAALALTVAVTLTVRALVDGGAEASESPALGPSIAYYVSPTPTPSPRPTPTDTPPPAPPAGVAPMRISIPRFGVDAPIVVLGVDSSGAMETPSGTWEAAWYDFSARPGSGGNAVLAGHVDTLYTGRPGKAVFYHLKDLGQGDIIELRGGDGSTHRYAVTSTWSVDGNTSDLGPIVGPTNGEAITLITCGGAGGTQYNERLVVRAERVG